MRLKEILNQTPWEVIPPDLGDWEISSLSSDSRSLTEGAIFFALSGTQRHGNQFIQEAILKGAQVVVYSETEKESYQLQNNILYLCSPDLKKYFLQMIQNFYGDCSRKIKVIGVTGTNGKTTITYLIESILQAAHLSSGLIGTIVHKIGSQTYPALNTTPGVLDNQRYLADLIKQKIPYCLMEVSSHALEQDRVDLIDFHTAIFSNLTSEHLDYHKNLECYFEAKAKLFQNLSPNSTAIINRDDPFGQRLMSRTSAQVLTYGLQRPVEIYAEQIQLDLKGMTCLVYTPKGVLPLESGLFGGFNIHNILAAVGFGLVHQIPLEHIKAGIESFRGVPGRMERVDLCPDVLIFIDYAHTEDALKNSLESIRKVSPRRLVLVFGCGGDRDKSKRPRMGAIASRLADHLYVTSDNPRSEDPRKIIEDIIPGLEKNNYEIMVDRRDAIEKALADAQKGDIILIAGKGHENYQILKDRKVDFDEKRIIQDWMKRHVG